MNNFCSPLIVSSLAIDLEFYINIQRQSQYTGVTKPNDRMEFTQEITDSSLEEILLSTVA